MRKIFLFGLLVSLFLFVSLKRKDYPIIKENEQYMDININRSTLADIKKVFGSKYKEQNYSWHLRMRDGYDDYAHINILRYEKEGISFLMDENDSSKKVVEKIIFNSPFKQATDKGISIGSSTFRDVILKYGSAGFWNNGPRFYSDKLSISFPGITFRTNKSVTTLDLSKCEKESFLDLKVDEIELTELKKK